MITAIQKLVEQTTHTALSVNTAITNGISNAADLVFNNDDMVLAGQASYDVVHDNGLVKLRHYHPLEEANIPLPNGDELAVSQKRHRVPLVIIPPLAVNMLIYDLFPNRSYVKYMLASGFDVYLVDWGAPQKEHRHYGFQEYVGEFMPEFLNKVREHSGQQEVSIQGWSMGGVFCLLYPSLTGDQDIQNIISVAAPVNTHASGPQGKVWEMVLNGPAQLIRRYTNFRVHNLDPKWFHIPGWANALGFKLTTPVGSLQGYWDLLMNLADREYVQKHTTTAAFLDGMVDYPGGIMQDMTIRVWLDNQFKRRRMLVSGKEVELGDCQASLLAFGGSNDPMVSAAAAKGALDVVASDDKQFVIAPGGHLGVLAGSKAVEHNWAITADWLAERSN